jgi:FlaA1/EpsC-like NDP-sugar epimerase
MNFLTGKDCLITGAAGSIGTELVRQVLKHDPRYIYILDHEETGIFDLWESNRAKLTPILTDIKLKDEIERYFEKYKPQIVFHAAAYKHVIMGEKFPEIVKLTNIEGTRNIVEASKKIGVEKLIFISTDKAVEPECVMGETKKEGERIVKEAGYISVRFGNVLASRGSVIPLWQKQIERGGPLLITHPDMQRYFMSISEAGRLIIKAAEIGKAGEIIALDMGSPIRILELAKTIIKLSGKEIEIKFIGPKPGEKLFEQLIKDDEVVEKRDELFIVKG